MIRELDLMNIKPHKPPNPITDLRQRVDYLRRFLNRVRPGMTTKDYYGWCEKIRSDMSAVPNDTVKAQAQALFQQVLSAADFVEMHPDKIDELVRPKITNLIDFLEKHDK